MPGAGVRVRRGRGGPRGPSDCDRVGLGTGNGLAGPGTGTRLAGEYDLLGRGPKRGKGNRGGLRDLGRGGFGEGSSRQGGGASDISPSERTGR